MNLKMYKDLIMIGSIAVLIILLFRSCGQNEESALEISRLENNLKAQQDTMRAYVTKNGNMAAEISAYKFDLKKDKELIDNLQDGYEELEGKLAGIAKGGATIIVDREVPVNVKVYTDTTGEVSLGDTTIYDASNFTKFSVTAPYTIKKNKIDMLSATYKSEIALDLLIRFEEKDGNLRVLAETPHKGVKFTSLTGGLVTEPDLPKSMKMALRKEWGIGFNAGLGPVYNISTKTITPGVFLGFGINFTPKKLQFGK
jgi:hypothetical protein